MSSQKCNGKQWKDISRNNVYSDSISKLTDLAQRSGVAEYLPCFIFMDALEDLSGLSQLVDADLSSNNGAVIVCKKNVKNYEQLWNKCSFPLIDVLEWTTENELVEYCLSLAEKNKAIEVIINSDLVKNNLVGESTVWRTFLKDIIEAAIFSTASVLLIGESGTGKELISRLIHTIDKRKNKKEIILVDCTTIIPELSGSEFFGHEKGSYTNAVQSRDGAFALANEGTLFLDEVGELPLHLQAELLRVIQEGTYKKVGSNAWQKTNFRLVCATNRDLHQQVKENHFRQDLYYRIADLEFRVPSLRDRIEDIPLLAKHFVREFFSGTEYPEFDDAVMEYLIRREYPGNIRELRQLVRRISLKHIRHKKITMGEIPLYDRSFFAYHEHAAHAQSIRSSLRKAILAGSSLFELKNKTMEEAIEIALDLSHGNKEQAAKRLGVTWRAILQFRKKISEQGKTVEMLQQDD